MRSGAGRGRGCECGSTRRRCVPGGASGCLSGWPPPTPPHPTVGIAHWCCKCTALVYWIGWTLVVFWYCTGTTLVQLWCCIHTVLVLYWHCAGTSHVLHSYSSGATVALYCSGSALVQKSYNTGIALVVLCYCCCVLHRYLVGSSLRPRPSAAGRMRAWAVSMQDHHRTSWVPVKSSTSKATVQHQRSDSALPLQYHSSASAASVQYRGTGSTSTVPV